jgi:hypothetical protein
MGRPLWRRRVCLLYMLLALASVVFLESESLGIRVHILLSQIRDPIPTWRAKSPYSYPPWTGCTSYTPGHWFPFSSLPSTLRATMEVFELASTHGHWNNSKFKVTLRLMVSQSVSFGVETHLRLMCTCILSLSLSLSLSLILRPTVYRPVCLGVKYPSGTYDQIFVAVRLLLVCWLWGALSNDRTGLSFTIIAGPRQRSHSRVQGPWHSQSQSQCYFTTVGLPPISLSWRQWLWDTRPEIFPLLNPCGISHFITSTLTRIWVCLLWICLTFRQVYISHI